MCHGNNQLSLKPTIIKRLISNQYIFIAIVSKEVKVLK